MSKIVWDKDGDRLYETGVKNGVLYLRDNSGAYPSGVAWNGLTTVTESPSGAEANPIYADDIKYLNLFSAEEFGATVEAYTYPDQFAECDGSAALEEGIFIGQQPRKSFGLCYKTTLGNDVLGDSYGYKLHLIYGCQASPSEKSYQTINDSPEAINFSWEVTTTPVNVKGHKPTSSIIIDSTKVADPTKLAILEALLYGCDEFSATATYAVGAVVSYGAGTEAKTYKCTTAVTEAGAWDASDWTLLSDKVGPQLPLPDDVYSIFYVESASA